MDQAMRIPFKCRPRPATHDWRHGRGQRRDLSNRGYIDPGLSMPVVLGVLVGSLLAREFSSSGYQVVAAGIQHRDRDFGNRDALQRLSGRI